MDVVFRAECSATENSTASILVTKKVAIRLVLRMSSDVQAIIYVFLNFGFVTVKEMF